MLRAVEQLLRGHRLQLVPGREVEPHDALDLGDVGLADLAERRAEPDHLVARQPVVDELAFLPPDDEPGLAQLLKVLGGVRHRHAGQGGELVDTALALGEQLEELEPGAARERGADPGELLEEVAFRAVA